MNNIKELKELIKDLPDEMPIYGLNSNGDCICASIFTMLKKDMSKQELRDNPEFEEYLAVSLD